MNIQPKLLSLDELFTKRLFQIPDYQRSYSWQKKQRKDLFADIEKIRERGEPHFMATVVCLRREVKKILTTHYQVMEIVDGQQRLTTLVILLKAVERALDPTNPTEVMVATGIRQLLVKADELAPVLLQTNHDSSQYCMTYLRNGTHPDPSVATTNADRCLLDAMVECEDFVQEWKTKASLSELMEVLNSNLTFILHEIDNEAVVYTVFEVLNSRGLDVSWFDRLKSILMGIAFEAKTGTTQDTIDELHRLWRDIYACIGLRQGLSSETLKFAATLWNPNKPSRPASEEEAVELLREAAGTSPKGVIDVTEWLLRVTKAVDRLAADTRRSGVTRINQARLLATAILLRDDLTTAERESLLGGWERVSFRIYGMCDKDSRTKVGDYVRLAWVIIKERPNAAAIQQELLAIGKDYPIEQAIAAMRDRDCYNNWQDDLRYFLFRYEEHLSQAQGQNFNSEQWTRIWVASAADSIEHVYPQSKGHHQQSPRGVYVHRLGNLVLLPPKLNSKLKDASPPKKADKYVETGLLQARDVAKRASSWNREAIIQREEELLAWAAEQWKD